MAWRYCCSWPAAVRMMQGRSRNPRVGPHEGENVEPADVRHHEIEQHEIDVAVPFEQVERLPAVEGERHAKRSPAGASSG